MPPQGTEPLTDSADGLHVRVTSLENRFEKFGEQIAASFSRVEDQISETNKTIQKTLTDISASRETGLGKILGAAGLVATLATFVIGGFVSFAKVNLDTNIADTRDKIVTSTEAVNDKIVATNVLVEKISSAVGKLADTTIPRPELEFRINTNRDSIAAIDKTIKESVVPRTEFERRIDTIIADVSTLKSDTLKREDLDGRFADFTKRLDLISNRVEELQSSTAGTAVLQEQVKEMASQVGEIRGRLLASPKYLVHPDGS